MRYSKLCKYYQQLSPFSDSNWEMLEKCLEPRHYEKGEKLVRTGDRANKMFVVLDGLLKSYIVTNKKKQRIKIFIRKFEIASPFFEIISDVPSLTSIEAMTSCNVLEMRYSELVNVLDRDIVFKQLHVKIVEFFYRMKWQREYEFLTMSAKERYEVFCQQYSDVIHAIPQNQIASYFGITPVSLSRLLSTEESDPQIKD